MGVNCPVCGWRFRNEKSLRGHMVTHHPGAEAAPGEPVSEAESPATSERRPGRWQLILSYVVAFLIPVGGVAAGLYLLIRNRSMHGIAVIAISLAVVAAVLVSGPG